MHRVCLVRILARGPQRHEKRSTVGGLRVATLAVPPSTDACRHQERLLLSVLLKVDVETCGASSSPFLFNHVHRMAVLVSAVDFPMRRSLRSACDPFNTTGWSFFPSPGPPSAPSDHVSTMSSILAQ
ncbi:hypothetical protein MRX96_028438 [Rhipicephalus microplus]